MLLSIHSFQFYIKPLCKIYLTTFTVGLKQKLKILWEKKSVNDIKEI